MDKSVKPAYKIRREDFVPLTGFLVNYESRNLAKPIKDIENFSRYMVGITLLAVYNAALFVGTYKGLEYLLQK